MFEISGMQIAVIILACLCAALIAGWLFRKDDKIERRRKNAIAIAAELKLAGIEFPCEFFTDYAVGDYSGMFDEAHRILERLKDPEQRHLALHKVFDTQLAARIKDPADLAKIKEAIAAAEPPKIIAVAPVVPASNAALAA